jgi:hypothetical protein
MYKIIHKLIRMNRDGLNVVADVNVVAASGGGQASARSRSRIVQRNGRTVTVTESDSGEETVDDNDTH